MGWDSHLAFIHYQSVINPALFRYIFKNDMITFLKRGRGDAPDATDAACGGPLGMAGRKRGWAVTEEAKANALAFLRAVSRWDIIRRTYRFLLVLRCAVWAGWGSGRPKATAPTATPLTARPR